MSSYWNTVGSKFNDGCAYKAIRRHKESSPCDNGSRDWTHAVRSHKTPGSTGSYHMIGRGKEEFFPGVSRGSIVLSTPEVTDLSITQAPESHLTNLYVDSGEHSNPKPRIWGITIYGLEESRPSVTVWQKRASLNLRTAAVGCWESWPIKMMSSLIAPQSDYIFHPIVFTLLSPAFFITVLTSSRQKGSLSLLLTLSHLEFTV